MYPNSQINREQQNPSSKNSAIIMPAFLTTLILVLVFFIILRLYTRWARLLNRPTRIAYYLDNNRPLASPTRGLHASVLNSLPLFVYSSQTNAKIAECAVCLSEFEEGENGRVLPNCKHSFHTECIDMWFFSHSTCPLCRSPVEPLETETSQMIMTTLNKPGSGAIPLSSPVQHVEERIEITSETDRRKRVDVRIDVPDRNESVAENEFRSSGSRLASFKRMISMSRKSPVASPSAGVGPSSVPVATESDIESAIVDLVQETSRPVPNP